MTATGRSSDRGLAFQGSGAENLSDDCLAADCQRCSFDPCQCPCHTGGHWRQLAACRGLDPEMFFPQRGDPSGQQSEAQAVCRRCSVRSQCLTEALDRNEHWGIWGGLTTQERDHLRGIRLPA